MRACVLACVHVKRSRTGKLLSNIIRAFGCSVDKAAIVSYHDNVYTNSDAVLIRLCSVVLCSYTGIWKEICCCFVCVYVRACACVCVCVLLCACVHFFQSRGNLSVHVLDPIKIFQK